MPMTNWRPFWDQNSKVEGFLVGKEVVPGSMEFKTTGMGIMWRYKESVSLVQEDATISERAQYHKGFQSYLLLML